MCPEMRLAGRDVPRFAPRARNSPRMPEICVACPRFALQRHRVMTNLPTFFLSLPSKYLPFLEPSSRYIYILHLTPLCTSAGVILDSGTFSDISDVLAFAKFEMGIFFKKYTHLEFGER